jgi:hypothetical protein
MDDVGDLGGVIGAAIDHPVAEDDQLPEIRSLVFGDNAAGIGELP